MKRVRTFALSLSLILAAAAGAEDIGQIDLFGHTYAVQKFDYSVIEYDNPLFPGFTINLLEVENTHYLGNGRVLMATDDMEAQGGPKNLITELRLTTDGDGNYTGLEGVRVIAWNDPNNGKFGGFDLTPGGITVNTGHTGLGAGGDIIVGSSDNFLAAYDLDTGIQTPCEGLECTIDISANNFSCEDIAYVPARDEFYTVQQDPPFSVQRFKTDGTPAGEFPIAEEFDPSLPGDPKGFTYLPATGDFRGTLAGRDVAMVILDDEGPGLQAFDLDGNLIGFETLIDDSGKSILDPSLDVDGQQFESGASDPATGRLFLTMQSDGFAHAFFYVLTPAANDCRADLTGDGTLDLFDFLAFVNLFNAQDELADWDGNGTFDLFDFLAFVNDFNAGC